MEKKKYIDLSKCYQGSGKLTSWANVLDLFKITFYYLNNYFSSIQDTTSG